MSQRDWQSMFLAEHDLIINILEHLKAEIIKSYPQKISNNVIQHLLQYLLDFGDKIHNVKEENHLFPLMVDHGIAQAGIMKQMLLDHEAERELLSRALLRLPEVPTISDDECSQLFTHLSDYIQNRKNHIKQENEKLYPLARKVIQEKDDEKLRAAFSIVDKKNNYQKLVSSILRFLQECSNRKRL